MKQFLKYVLASALGTLLVGVFFCFMSFIMLVAIITAGSSKQPTVVTEGSILRISMFGELNEQVAENPFAELMGSNQLMQSQGLNDMLTAIRIAKTNEKISGIFLDGGLLAGHTAQLEELEATLQDFKKSGKFVYAYADQYTTGSYLLATTANKVALNPQGMLDWHGMGSQVVFFTELLEKLGVKMQIFKVGTFKSAVEPFILTKMSDANREQMQSFIGDVWNTVRTKVAANRKLSADTLNAYADRYITFADAEDYVKMGLVDTLAYIDGVRDDLRKLSKQEKVNFVSPSDLITLNEPKESENKIAIYYAEGSIVDFSGVNPLTGGNQKEIVGSEVVEALDKLASDDNVKAVVLRINSGGGSAYASEQMWRAVQLLKAKKPVVVSMSGMAASGGYYMACGANKIVADASTLTGSIGIFGMFPDASSLLTNKLGIHFDQVKTNEASDFGTPARPLNIKESAMMQAYVERGYKLFLKRVAEGRKMKTEQVDKIAQGRVWTGRQALKLKLVDKLGTLDTAVKEAAALAKLGDDYAIQEPTPRPWFESLINNVKDDYLEQQMRTRFGWLYEPMLYAGSIENQNPLQAKIPFHIEIK